ncbi:hypothetical protein J7444_19905 [Labrenzia sp. R4_1]|uniref:hypothetical protein n=1 Tax=Stappiaceae TaxID=2821832 RepID=UPI001AD9E5BB|nr:hypothetical protein [Labrenzia sp. R4_1]MBO9427010.1 hypothetical protein [Labrenzia sp. R4_1]
MLSLAISDFSVSKRLKKGLNNQNDVLLFARSSSTSSILLALLQSWTRVTSLVSGWTLQVFEVRDKRQVIIANCLTGEGDSSGKFSITRCRLEIFMVSGWACSRNCRQPVVLSWKNDINRHLAAGIQIHVPYTFLSDTGAGLFHSALRMDS